MNNPMIVPDCRSDSFCRFMEKFFRKKDVLKISYRPKNKYQHNNCYENVKKHISQNGGDIIYGWSIWEWPHVFIEAFHHALWKNPEGRLIDISPDDMPRYENKRMALNDDPLIAEFINTCVELNETLSKINPGQYGLVNETPELMCIQIKLDRLREQIEQKYS